MLHEKCQIYVNVASIFISIQSGLNLKIPIKLYIYFKLSIKYLRNLWTKNPSLIAITSTFNKSRKSNHLALLSLSLSFFILSCQCSAESMHDDQNVNCNLVIIGGKKKQYFYH